MKRCLIYPRYRSRTLTNCVHVSSLGQNDQRIIDKAVRQWRTRLCACIKAKGGHFEHT